MKLLIIILLSVVLYADYECKEPTPVWRLDVFEYQTQVDAYNMSIELYLIASYHYEVCMTKYQAPMRMENIKDKR